MNHKKVVKLVKKTREWKKTSDWIAIEMLNTPDSLTQRELKHDKDPGDDVDWETPDSKRTT